MFVIAFVCIVGPFVIIGACALSMAREETPKLSPMNDALTEGNDLFLEDDWTIAPCKEAPDVRS